MVGPKKENRAGGGRVVRITDAGSQKSRRVRHRKGGSGAQELRSSVIRVNGKNASPTRHRRKKAKKKFRAVR